jgi:hypothetical protein
MRRLRGKSDPLDAENAAGVHWPGQDAGNPHRLRSEAAIAAVCAAIPIPASTSRACC